MKKTIFKIAMLSLLVISASSVVSCQKSSSSNEEITSNVKAPKTPIHDAVIRGEMETVQQHIEAGTNIDQKDAMGGSSPLILAAVFDKPEIAQTLIDAGADLNVRNNDGSTALITASFFCRMEILEALIEAGADQSIKNNFGATALESMTPPFEQVKSVYEMMGQQLSGFGLQIDLERIEKARPEVVKMLQQ